MQLIGHCSHNVQFLECWVYPQCIGNLHSTFIGKAVVCQIEYFKWLVILYNIIIIHTRYSNSNLHTIYYKCNFLTMSPTATALAPFFLIWFQLKSNVWRASLSAIHRVRFQTVTLCKMLVLRTHSCLPRAGPKISPETSLNSLWLKSRCLMW